VEVPRGAARQRVQRPDACNLISAFAAAPQASLQTALDLNTRPCFQAPSCPLAPRPSLHLGDHGRGRGCCWRKPSFWKCRSKRHDDAAQNAPARDALMAVGPSWGYASSVMTPLQSRSGSPARPISVSPPRDVSSAFRNEAMPSLNFGSFSAGLQGKLEKSDPPRSESGQNLGSSSRRSTRLNQVVSHQRTDYSPASCHDQQTFHHHLHLQRSGLTATPSKHTARLRTTAHHHPDQLSEASRPLLRLIGTTGLPLGTITLWPSNPCD